MTSVKDTRPGWVTKNPNRVISDDGETVVIEAIHRGAPVHVKVDKKDWDDGLYRFRWSISGKGYAHTSWRQSGEVKIIVMHRVLLPTTMDVDHINGIRTDNRSCNLRQATRSQNLANCKSAAGSASKYKGVYPDHRRCLPWRMIPSSRLRHKYSRQSYATEEEAARAYDLITREEYGEHGRYNFPLPGERSALREE